MAFSLAHFFSRTQNSDIVCTHVCMLIGSFGNDVDDDDKSVATSAATQDSDTAGTKKQ